MAIDLNLLDPAFAAQVTRLLQKCSSLGYEMRPYAGMRSPIEQARLWRQSRPIEEIKAKIAAFDAAGANFLASCLRKAGPQNGDHVTDAPPGYSWHQWGEAVDVFWVVGGKAQWSTRTLIKGRNGYRVYADAAAAMGLTAGGLWPRFKDWPHVQLRATGSPARALTLLQIDSAMKARFGH
ncbi:M15 family metallopeptidase [Caenimonas sp. SL110]|uniref:M15 family metallopeptidase n=1 Tax=Caenimonas sp. SL110 TaxID=1450524 RepID=UPI000654B969|nr:M15 family metallopeptidase [Caenimonas sp. SL110]